MIGRTASLIVMAAIMAIGGCAKKSFKLNHDYPAPPSVKRLTEPGACQGGGALAALDLPLPKYPGASRRAGRQGWVVVQLDVLPSGATHNVQVKQDAPEGMFDRSAIKGVQQWRFQPVGGEGLHNCLVFISYRLGQVRIGR